MSRGARQELEGSELRERSDPLLVFARRASALQMPCLRQQDSCYTHAPRGGVAQLVRAAES